VSWPAVVLLVVAAVLAAAGALAARAGRSDAPAEARATRAIAGLGLLVVAAALAAIGGALLGAGDTGQEQIGAFAFATATVALPLLAVGLVRSRRRPAPVESFEQRGHPRSPGRSHDG
jgi:hypothetical protein